MRGLRPDACARARVREPRRAPARRRDVSAWRRRTELALRCSKWAPRGNLRIPRPSDSIRALCKIPSEPGNPQKIGTALITEPELLHSTTRAPPPQMRTRIAVTLKTGSTWRPRTSAPRPRLRVHIPRPPPPVFEPGRKGRRVTFFGLLRQNVTFYVDCNNARPMRNNNLRLACPLHQFSLPHPYNYRKAPR